jgi:cytochrome P450
MKRQDRSPALSSCQISEGGRRNVSVLSENRSMQAPPGPRGTQVLGFFGRSKAGTTLDFLEQTARRYGPIASFRILNRRIYIVDDAELIKEMLVTRQHSFERDSGAQLLRELLGDSVITREEPQHKERRRMLQPAFHKEQIAHYASIMTQASNDMAARWAEGEIVDTRAEMRKLTLEIVGASLFGADFTESAERVSDVLQRVVKTTRSIAPIFAFLEPLVVLYRRLNPQGRSLFFSKERAELDQILRPVLEKQKSAAISGQSSMLNLLSGEEGILDEMVTFMLAGHETTATALMWAWYLLARNPEVEARLHTELDGIADEIGIETLPQLPYTGMVFQEAMRLYPPALAFARRAKEDLQLGGYTIPKGSSVFISPYITQRNPLYFEEPLEFRPERWASYAGPKFAYFPFGGGAKMCIGEPFARLEGVIALAILARRWKLENTDPEPARIAAGFLLRPDKPIQMRVSTRVPIGGMMACAQRVTL